MPALAARSWKDLRSRSQHSDCSDQPDHAVAEVVMLLASAIERLAPPVSHYRENTRRYLEDVLPHGCIEVLPGFLRALRADYEANRLKAIHELIHADVFSDFLEMAEYLQQEGWKAPEAIIAGSTLEAHLRNLCVKYGTSASGTKGPKKASQLNADLARASAYSKLDEKNVIAWLGVRKEAAHGDYTAYTKEQVARLISGIRDFIARHPA